MLRKLSKDCRGQDMIEYALLAGFLASCAVAAFPMINATGIRFSQVVQILSTALSTTANAAP